MALKEFDVNEGMDVIYKRLCWRLRDLPSRLVIDYAHYVAKTVGGLDKSSEGIYCRELMGQWLAGAEVTADEIRDSGYQTMLSAKKHSIVSTSDETSLSKGSSIFRPTASTYAANSTYSAARTLAALADASHSVTGLTANSAADAAVYAYQAAILNVRVEYGGRVSVLDYELVLEKMIKDLPELDRLIYNISSTLKE